MRLLAEALHAVPKLELKVINVAAAEVPQLDLLEVRPNPFVGVQLGRVAREPLKPKATAGASPQEVLHRLAPVNAVAVPDDRQLAANEPQKMSKEPNHVGALERAVLDVEVQLAGQCDRADRGEVIV